MRSIASVFGIVAVAALLGTGCAAASPAPSAEEPLRELVLPANPILPRDVTNRHADDARAAALGKKFFFDPRFSGPLLDEANNGLSNTLGVQGEVGKVACASCHMPKSRAFVDVRSARGQLSLASSWTHRKAPSLLDVSQVQFLTWDGRRDTAFSQVFAPIESPLEFNSSRLFVAQQIARLYKDEYEALFGPLPSLSNHPVLAPSEAGCTELPADPAQTSCPVPGQNDEAVTRVVTNFGKAIQAYTRTLSCGRSRFDAWMDGDETALTPDEQAGAQLFVTKGGCNSCHSGPYLTDQLFYNLGVPGGPVPFTGVNTANDPGAAVALEEVQNDWLNSKGLFSDGDDRRLDRVSQDSESLLGAFRTPSLRCVSRRAAFMHNGQFRSLEDVIDFFSDGEEQGGSDAGYVGHSVNYPRNFSEQEKAQLLAFLEALDGSGPDPASLVPPELPGM